MAPPIPPMSREAMTTEGNGEAKPLGWEDCPLVGRDPKRLGGAWTVGNTRLPIHAIFDNLGAGATIKELTEWFEGLTEEQVRGILTHAARMLEQDRLGPEGRSQGS